MSDKKIKAYGLINFTKRQYIVTQVIVFSLLAIILFVSYLYAFSSSENIVIKYTAVICVVVLTLEVFETVVMLKKFNETPTD